MYSNIQKLKDFFLKKKSDLESFYPGINWKRLESEWEVFVLRYSDNARVSNFINLLERATPLEYITGVAYFYKAEFLVDSNTLIPRSETETLVELALKEINKEMRIADIGTGSGCIPLSIAMDAKFPLDIVATDISTSALNTAKKNSFRLEYTRNKKTKLEWVCTDRLKDVKGKFSLIVSNPPYIKEGADRKLVHEQVHNYEPHTALYLKDDDYDHWFSELFKTVYSSLEPRGVFIMEGHEEHLNNLAPLAEQFGLKDVKILPDLTGSHRFLRGIKLEG
ncbi:MAG: protein-(glutamine-N5) methyltransferase, release factor-specific [Halobacteriovorax sp.]|nr:protein-(glutamine-N5) methyltransferase, release factor-specific [Halobacteriovorax sp.]|tara:strand:- start:32602 stop:33438 length:837 start_codon:yes stop_codon:yes gene_type:complete